MGRILSRCAARHRGALLASGVLLLAAVAALLGSRVARARASARLLAEAERSLHAGDYPRAAATIEAARGTAWTPRHQAVRDEAFGVLPVQIHTVPAGASVQVRLVDAASGQVAEHGIDTRSGAEDGLVSLPLGIGAHAVTVSVPGLGYGEYLLEVARDQGMRRLDATIRPTGECIADMERVEGGIYRVGRDRVAGARRTPVLPEREVQVAPFWLDRSEVSRQQFVAFTRATGRPAPWVASDLAGDAGKLPATGISWSEACAYAEWAGKRLPSEIEWEAAARGRNGMRYPWGDEFVAANAVLGPTFVVSPDAPTRIAAGRLPAAVDAVTADVSSCGCLHLIGNVREWTSTPWHVHDPSGGPQWLLPRNGQVVVKGSSYRQCCSDLACAASARTPFFRDERQDDLGFRCAKSDLR